MSKLQMRYHVIGLQYYLNLYDVIALLETQKGLETDPDGKESLEEALQKLKTWKADITAPSKATLKDQAARRKTAEVGAASSKP